MLKNSYKLLFVITLISGTMISISATSWFSVWMGLEINLLSFIPLMMKTNNLFSSEASLKYFLTQAIASCILLFSIILFFFTNEMISNNWKIFLNLIFASTLMMKTGIAPFHFWFPNVMEGLNWFNNFILMTWQKIAPMILLSFCLNFFLFNIIIIFSIFIGAMGGLNQTSMRKIMAFSSINHLGWMLSNIMNNENLWKIYFLFYSFLSFSIIFILNNFKLFNINQMFSMKMKNIKEKLFINLPLLSLGGLPPFLGFFPKWITIEMMMMNNLTWLILLMINFTLITLYFYIRISFSSFMLNHHSLNWNFYMMYNQKIKNLFLNMIIFFTIFGLMLMNMFFIFL